MQLKVKGQTIEWISDRLTVSGSDGIYTVEFTFEDDADLQPWAGMSKFAVFKNSNIPKYQDGVYVPIENGSAVIPAGIISVPGKLSVGVYGQNGYYTMPTIWACPVAVQRGCGEGQTPADTVMTASQNAIKYGENAQVFAEGGYIVKKVEGSIGDPIVERLPEYTKGAKQYAQEAAESAVDAAGSASAASGSAEDSEAWAVGQRDGVDVDSEDPAYHNNAKYYAGAAGQSASDAARDAGAASNSAGAAAGSATEAESYAKGGTGTRAGEDTDNSKYYKEQAASSASAASDSAAAADGSAEDSEAWADGQRDGVDVPSTDPTYHNNAKHYKEQAASSASAASDSAAAASGSAEDSEAWAVGQRDGVDVPSTDPTYENNSKHYADEAAAAAAIAVQTIHDGNFFLVDLDDNNKKYIMSFAATHNHIKISFNEYVEE